MEHVECILCEGSSSRVVIEENGYQGRKCDQCGMVFVSPRPSLSEIVNLYSEDRSQESARQHLSRSLEKKLHARHTLRLLRRYLDGGSLLEEGAAAGGFLAEAKKAGFEPHALELNGVLARHIRDNLGIPCEDTPLERNSFGGKKFDVIYHCNVLSHLYDPVAEFRKINDCLRNGGFLVFESGNFSRVKEKYYKWWDKFYYPEHLFSMGENNYEQLLEMTGFQLLRM